MTGVKRPTEKHLMLFTGRAHPELAESVAEIMGVELTQRRLINSATSSLPCHWATPKLAVTRWPLSSRSDCARLCRKRSAREQA